MPQYYYQALNTGVIDRDKLHRTDLEKMRLAAEDQTNLICNAVGKAFLRPGFEHLQFTNGSSKARLIEFSAGDSQVYALELTNNALKILDEDAFVSRPAVTTTITNGNFSSGVGWTLGTDAGTVVTVSGGYLLLQAPARKSRAKASQQITVSGGNVGLEHGIRIRIERGPVRFRLGSTLGGQEYMQETTLFAGYHSLAIVPTGNFYIEFSTDTQRPVYVDDVNIEAAGDVVIPTLWTEAQLPLLRYDQSLDVMFVACEGVKQQRIESRGDNSWSVVDYIANDGPFAIGPTYGVKLRPTSLERSGDLISNVPFFTTDHIGATFRLYQEGQNINTVLAADGAFTPTIMVTGINEPDYNERAWTYSIAGTWAGTLRVQRSFDGEDIQFHNFRKEQASADIDITTNVGPIINDDNEDNAIAYYRIGFEDGTYTSGEVAVSINYQGGGGYGICRVVGYTSPTSVVIEILRPFTNDTFTEEWRQGAWSTVMGWPTSVAFHEGRLWWAGYDGVWASVSDAYDSFDEDFIGDAGPLLRSIALGGRNIARWIVPLSNLMVGTNGLIAACRGSSLDEIMTPENFGIRRLTRIGASPVNPAALADDRALFVEASANALYELTYSPEKGRFLAGEFSKLTTNLFDTGVTGIAVQNRPDQRIWVTTQNGDAVCIVFEPAQQVVAFIPVSTGNDTDFIESIVVLPGFSEQDRVVASIKRVVGGVTTRRIERLAMDSEAIPAAVTKCLDSHVTFGAGSATINLPHLIGRTVWAWVDGGYIEDADAVPVPFVVSVGGTITLPSVPAVGGCAGAPYVGRYKSAKLEYAGAGSSSALKAKTLAGIGLLMGDYCRSGVKYGAEFDNAAHPLFDLPRDINGVPVLNDITLGPGDPEFVNGVDAKVLTDARMCIELSKPGAIFALVMDFQGYGG